MGFSKETDQCNMCVCVFTNSLKQISLGMFFIYIYIVIVIVIVVVVQSPSHVQLFATPWTAACQAIYMDIGASVVAQW